MYYDYGVECKVDWDSLTEEEMGELGDETSITSCLLRARQGLRQLHRNFQKHWYVTEDPFHVHCAEEAIDDLEAEIEKFLQGRKDPRQREHLEHLGDWAYEAVAEMLNGRPWV